jgi:ADP-ribose pyrophosphatase
MNKEESPTKEEAEHFIKSGISMEPKDGRPLHPWFYEMITDPRLGVVRGKGFYYHWGPNVTADTVVISPKESVLLIQRKDNKQWALPGGFVDAGEDPIMAAIREVWEETMVDISHMPMESVYEGPVADFRVTANAWAKTNAFVALVEREIECSGADDALVAAWVSKEDLASILKFGSHSLLVELAFAKRSGMIK